MNGKPLIMVADDNSKNIRIIKECLDGAVEVRSAKDGLSLLQALEELSKENTYPDVLIIDYFMPRADGLEAIKALRQNKKYQNLPTLVLTQRGDIEAQISSVTNGFDLFLAKPINSVLLKQHIKVMLELAKGRKNQEIVPRKE